MHHIHLCTHFSQRSLTCVTKYYQHIKTYTYAIAGNDRSIVHWCKWYDRWRTNITIKLLIGCVYEKYHQINTLRPRQNSHHFPDDISKWIFLNENAWISIKISLKFVPRGPINNIPSLVQIMAWRRPGDKPLSEPMMGSLLTHICVTRPQWVKLSAYEMGAIHFTLAMCKR